MSIAWTRAGTATDGALPIPLRSAVVAIPACNEADLLGPCLDALAAQVDGDGRALPRGAFGMLLLLNNCDDGSASVARAAARRSRFPLRIVDTRFADDLAHAGFARRTAMDMASAWLAAAAHGTGTILTTDADSRVGATWLSDNLRAIAAGADAVAGRIMLDGDDAGRLDAALRRRGALEARYEALLTEASARLDPQPDDPWPRHWTESGASIAVTRGAYEAVGGVPDRRLGEDRALMAALADGGFSIRHDPSIVVTTSGRLTGRAPGGAADTMKRRTDDPDAVCDDRLEPLADALARYRLRGRLRRMNARGESVRFIATLRDLGLGPETATGIATRPTFARAWREIEAVTPALGYRPLRPSQLPAAIAEASVVLATLRNPPEAASARRAAE